MVSFGIHWFSCFVVRMIIVVYYFVISLDMSGRVVTCNAVHLFFSNIFFASDCLKVR